jgi:hypothetical protein
MSITLSDILIMLSKAHEIPELVNYRVSGLPFDGGNTAFDITFFVAREDNSTSVYSLEVNVDGQESNNSDLTIEAMTDLLSLLIDKKKAEAIRNQRRRALINSLSQEQRDLLGVK